MANGTVIISDEVLDTYAEEANEIVKHADYSSCPVTGQDKVQRFQTAALTALINSVRTKSTSSGNGNGNGKKDWKSLLWFMASKSPWAVACVMIVGMVIYASKMNWI